MTGEKDPTKGEPRTAGEKKRRTHWGETGVYIGRALQRAAGFPASGPLICRENPWDADSGGAHPPILDTAIREIFRAGDTFYELLSPQVAEPKLEKVRKDIKRLKNSIASLGEYIEAFIDLNGDPGPGTERIIDEEAQAEWDALADDDKTACAMADFYFVPPEEYTISVALSAMAKLDAAIVQTIEEAIEASAKMSETSKNPKYARWHVAYVVARYLYDVTGDIPGLTTSPTVTGPFALALQEIFEILDLPKSVQRPGEYAKLKLTSELSENSEL